MPRAWLFALAGAATVGPALLLAEAAGSASLDPASSLVAGSLLLTLPAAFAWSRLRPSAVVPPSAVLPSPEQPLDIAAALDELGPLLVAGTAPATVMQRVAALARPLLDADLVAVAAPDASGALHWAAVAGNRTDAWEPPGPLPANHPDEPAPGEGHLAVAGRSLPELARHITATEGLVTAFAVPVRDPAGNAVGALLAGYRGPREVSRADQRTASVLAGQAALSLQNAQMSKQLGELAQFRDDLLSRAAHELKTPITSLLGFAQLTRRQIERSSPGQLDAERTAHIMRVIDDQAQKLARLMSQLVDSNHVAAGSLALERRPVDLVEVLCDAVALMQPVATQHTIVLRAAPPLMIEADAFQLEQAVASLLDNAIKFSPNGGEIVLDAKRDGDAAVFTVTDRGIGIAPERRGRIFDRAVQAHGSLHFGGMGLGLYITREIVELHGGQIAAEFPETGGTRMVVTLPLAAAASPPPDAATAPLPPAAEQLASA